MRERRRDVGILRVQSAGDNRLASSGEPVGHQHRFAAGGRAVVHRRVGDLHAGEVRHLRLELEQNLERALRDFRLVGRVAGQELGTLDEMVDGRRYVALVGARAEKERDRAGRDAQVGHRAQSPLDRHFAHGQRHVEQTLDPLVGGNVGKQRVDVGNANSRQHHLAFGCVERQIAHRSAQRLEVVGVGGLVHQGVKLGRIGKPDAKQPTAPEGVFIDEAGRRIRLRN